MYITKIIAAIILIGLIVIFVIPYKIYNTFRKITYKVSIYLKTILTTNRLKN